MKRPRPQQRSKRSRVQRPASSRTWLGAALIGAVLAAGGALLAAPALMRTAVAVDADGCPKDFAAPAHTLVLVDASEALAPRHKRLLNAAVTQEARTLPAHGRLSLVALDAANPEEPRWLISLCSPGDGGDANPLFANPARLRAAWEKRFIDPLEDAARRAGANRGDSFSPILEAIRSATGDPRWLAAEQRSLVLVSDLMENTPARSLYDADVSYRADRDRALTLDGADVRVVFLDRPAKTAVQSTAWARFWAPLLEDSNPGQIEPGRADAAPAASAPVPTVTASRQTRP